MRIRCHFDEFISNVCIVTVFEPIWNFRKIIENNYVSKACILAVFETIWNCREKDENKDACKRMQYDTF